jgi:uncharacterized protein with NRDE domain
MCTLISLFQAVPDTPLVLALNRDELLSRPTTPMHRWEDEPIVAGRYDLSGGTWFAVGAHMVVGITNHRRGNASPRGTRSRGELVVRAAKAQSVDEVAGWLTQEDPEAFGGFHLLACDGRSLRCFTNASGSLREEPAGPGVHVLGNFGLDDANDPIVQTVGPAARALLDAGLPEDELAAGLQGVLRRHGDGWPCVHWEGVFGTRMSAVLLWRPTQPRLWLADGPPCEAPFAERSELLAG